MYARSLLLAALLLVGSCGQNPGTNIAGKFEPKLNTQLTPGQSSVPDTKGNVQPIASSRDADGVVSDFVVGVVRLRRVTEAELQAFLERYGGTVIGDDGIPLPPAGSGITLTDEQRRPTEYVIRIDLSKVDTSLFADNGAADGLTGTLEISSDDGMRTLAAVKDAKAAGFHASADYMTYPQLDLPTLLFDTSEGKYPSDGSRIDALTLPRFAMTGSKSNLALALQYVTAHGIQRRVKVAIVDGGFWLDAAGNVRTRDGANAPVETDFPLPPATIQQHDFVEDDDIADGPNFTCLSQSLVSSITGEAPDFCWHGTGAAAVATGIINNNAAWAGTGGLVADPMLLRMTGTDSQIRASIRYAVAMGADVVSISYGGKCNQSCRIDERENTPLDDAIAAGSKTVFIAGAGNENDNVGDPNFYHPCINDHMICVGALENDKTTKSGTSNYGERVDLFAPTNIPVMPYPNRHNIDPESAVELNNSFSGTSASAPFVAGVAAMMKAINPDLNSDQVGAILRETAHPGADNVTRYLDAYAAVRRAAENGPRVRDRFENNDLREGPANLGTAQFQDQYNLNLDADNDIDYYRIDSPGPSVMRVDVQYMELLGTFDFINPESLGACGAPTYLSDEGLKGRGHRWEYKVSGGPQQFALRGNHVNGYNLLINFIPSASIAPDTYEPNDTVPQAKYIHSVKPAAGNSKARSEARVTIDASIQTVVSGLSDPDVDYFIVRAANLTFAQQILLVGYPSVEVYGNEAPMKLDVWKLKTLTRTGDPDNVGALVDSVSGASCSTQRLSVRLDPDQYYLVKVEGVLGQPGNQPAVGRYTLRNGLDTKKRDIPILVLDPIYIILHPGDPIEHAVRFDEKYIFVADGAYSQVRSKSPGIHLALLDYANNLISDGVSEQGLGELLSLVNTTIGQIYALQVTPQIAGAEPPTLQLEWTAAQPARVSANLIVNPGAETGIADGDDDFPGWDMLGGLLSPRLYFYEAGAVAPSPTDPGPSKRGSQLFAGGNNNSTGLQQLIFIDASWQQAINDGHVKFNFSAFLGGYLEQADHANAGLTFLDANQQPLGEVTLPSITPLEREGQTGLFQAEANDVVPPGTAIIRVELTFTGVEGDFNDGYADNIELILSDYIP